MTRVARGLASLLALLAAWPATASAQPFAGARDTAGEAFHVRLDTDVSWGIGAQMFLGAQVHLIGQLIAWQGDDATGSFDVGLRMAYGNEPAFLAPWRAEYDGQENHRFQAQLGLGHSFHLLADRALAIGAHVLVGVSHYNRTATLDWPEVGVLAHAQEGRNDPVVSAEVTIAGRLHEHVGVNVAIGAPFPTTSSVLITMVHVSAGLSFYLR